MNVNVQKHIPVMLEEVLQSLQPKDGRVYVDATFGFGGYSEAILNAANCKVIALDRDPTVLERAEEFKKKYKDRFEFKAGKFGYFASLVMEDIDGAVFDIGVSSMQIDNPQRGFSHSKEAPLDMRMSCEGISAKDIVNTYSETELADLIYAYGEDRKSRVIARKIVEYRQTKEIETTTELAEIIYSAIYRPKFGELNPATRTFQALRIAVNDELGQLQSGLEGAVKRLKTGAPLVVVDFHSLEDRIVKLFFKENCAKKIRVSKYAAEAEKMQPSENFLFSQISKVIVPTKSECEQNPRAHCAKLRYAIRG
jgi:16S rRNA (cytosine1402-N4)-methyltransferase